jgi:uncharacterized protein involved in exopolysaccharide biosynthesis
MRVYGANPLYNYVELIFRSKRLFIVSMILATFVTASLAMLRSNTYSATATVLLTGSQDTGPQQLTEQQRGSVQYKIDVLNLVLKDPNFIKEFLTDAGLDRGQSPEQFDAYARDVKKALSYTAGENILEISCKWRSPQCEDIVTAFVSEYRKHVTDMETVISHTQTTLLASLLTEYDDKLTKLQQHIADWQLKHIKQPVVPPDEADREVQQQQQTVQGYQMQLDQSTQKLHIIETQLAKEHPTISERTIREQSGQLGPSMDTLTLENKKEELTHTLATLRTKYTDQHPRVIQAERDLQDVQDRLKTLNDAAKAANSSKKPAPSDPIQRKDIPNPRYQELQYNRDEANIEVNTLKNQVENSKKLLGDLMNIAKQAPGQVVEYNQLTKDREVYTADRATLAAKLEEAKMEERRDTDLHSNEITMMIPPKAEPELVGAKSIIFYVAGPILGIVIAFGISLLAETMDPTLRTPQEVEKHLNKPVLAVLPTIKPDRRAARRLLKSSGEMPPEMPPSSS